MNSRLLIMLAIVAGSFACATTASAYNYHHGIMSVTNNTKYQIWVTTYNIFRHQINYGWVQPHQTVNYDNCCYLAGSKYYVRAEVKITENGQMRQLADLDVAVQPALCGGVGNGASIYALGKAVLEPGRLKGEYTGAYWKDESAGCPAI